MEHPRRPTCPQCARPLRTCLCRWVTPVDNMVDVLILQHPLEVGQAKGSAVLLQRSLQHQHLSTGEQFDAAALDSLLHAGGRTSVLLYPDEPGTAQPVDKSPVPAEAGRLRLVVLDGTWRKSRKLLHLNPALQRLPRLALAAPPPSQYTIRKAHRPDQLSTLEATCLALAQLEQAPARYTPLLTAFSGFVGHLAATARSGTSSAEAGECGDEV
ncbi:tRNA-uridine aminocarboxypropyltransferase [Sphaerotilus sp.]|uniref:tRNA-uridine aminocarboxypropyltransferase n=1 Tax=Sphaerotilus sp. TaxID=2093942 RepID=UPI002ACDC2C6|nr:tRNA-uridine aminocarboxypropyltransferase [Sphaerotilus sp.]MDZ7856742.1 tRNA-uridine aminocarboxypropyltransferase [Sphaerotilus sp.]